MARPTVKSSPGSACGDRLAPAPGLGQSRRHLGHLRRGGAVVRTAASLLPDSCISTPGSCGDVFAGASRTMESGGSVQAGLAALPELPAFPEGVPSIEVPRIELPSVELMSSDVVRDALRASVGKLLEEPPYPHWTVRTALEAAQVKGLHPGAFLEKLPADLTTSLTANPGLLATAVLITVLVLQRIQKAKSQKREDDEKERQEIQRRVSAAKEAKRLKRAQQLRVKIRGELKVSLMEEVKKLQERAVLPGEVSDDAKRAKIARLADQLKGLTLAERPLESLEGDVVVTGSWELVYASKGTVVTRSFLSDYEGILPPEVLDTMASLESLPGIPVLRELTQELQLEGDSLITENAAVLTLENVGMWRISSKGTWTDSGDGITAQVVFESFAVQPTKLLGMDSAQLPEVRIPVPTPLQREAKWETFYLDEDLRISEGSAGRLFMFRKAGASQPYHSSSSKLQLPTSPPKQLKWTPEAQADLDRAPFFVKDAAKQKAEDYAMANNLDQIDMAVVNASK